MLLSWIRFQLFWFLLLSRLQFLNHRKKNFMRGKERKRVNAKSCVILMIPWILACQSPVYIRFSRQEYCSWLHFLRQGNFPNLECNPDLKNCRQMLYQLSFAESPYVWKSVHKFSYVKYWDFIFHWKKNLSSNLKDTGFYISCWKTFIQIFVGEIEFPTISGHIFMYEIEIFIRSCRTIDKNFCKCYIERIPYLMKENRHRFPSENHEKFDISFRIYI